MYDDDEKEIDFTPSELTTGIPILCTTTKKKKLTLHQASFYWHPHLVYDEEEIDFTPSRLTTGISILCTTKKKLTLHQAG